MKGKILRKNKKLTFITYIILFIILIYSGIKILKWYVDSKNNNKIIEQVQSCAIVKDEDNEIQEHKIDFKSLKVRNNETVAWIKVNGTNIDYPVVKTLDNSFYLKHSFDKSQNSAGWIFADYRNKFDGNDRNIIIYGHNMKDGSMFGSLRNILDSSWYDNEENTNIILECENEREVYRVFSIYKIKSEDYYIKTEFKDDSEFEQFIKKIKERSIKDFDTDISNTSTILTLSTCANNNYRVVLHAKKVQE